MRLMKRVAKLRELRANVHGSEPNVNKAVITEEREEENVEVEETSLLSSQTLDDDAMQSVLGTVDESKNGNEVNESKDEVCSDDSDQELNEGTAEEMEGKEGVEIDKDVVDNEEKAQTNVEREPEMETASPEVSLSMVQLESSVEWNSTREDIPIWQQLRILSSSPLFLLCTFSLSGLYFVVTGIMFWITDYLISDPQIKADPALCIVLFAITALTAPIFGVLTGGWFIDRSGGYKDDTGQAVYLTLRTCVMFGSGAVVCAIPAALVPNFVVIIVFVWLVLFFGGALVPGKRDNGKSRLSVLMPFSLLLSLPRLTLSFRCSALFLFPRISPLLLLLALPYTPHSPHSNSNHGCSHECCSQRFAFTLQLALNVML